MFSTGMSLQRLDLPFVINELVELKLIMEKKSNNTHPYLLILQRLKSLIIELQQLLDTEVYFEVFIG